METKFYSSLTKELLSSLTNNYRDNYDYHRFGKLSLKQRIKESLKGILCANGFYRIDTDSLTSFLNSEGIENGEYLHSILNNPQSKELLIKILLYKVLGHNKIKLPLSEAGILQLMDESKTYSDPNDTLQLSFLNWKLLKYDLGKLNYPITLYGVPEAIVNQFILRQYVYQTPEVTVRPECNDIILDCGACFGDTALFFAHETGLGGKIYSFEFIKGNVEIYKKNISLNPSLAKQIMLIEQPLWEQSGCHVFYSDNGPASKVGFEKFVGAENETVTISIDDMVKKHALEKVDFIKMDIEGSELSALKGAVETLKEFKPKLAISVYHKRKDFREIPEFIKNLSQGYRLYLNHYTIHAEETVLYAIHN